MTPDVNENGIESYGNSVAAVGVSGILGKPYFSINIHRWKK